MKYEPLTQFPDDIDNLWQAEVIPAQNAPAGVFRLVNIRPTASKTFEEQRIVVLVLDENGFPMPNIPVAFAYSTAPFYNLQPGFTWQPPHPRRAFIVPTQGSGQIDQIQGSAVKPGEPGGITVYLLHPEYASDVLTGGGMLQDHTGMHLTFQLQRPGILPLDERLINLETRLKILEDMVAGQ